MTVSAKVRKSLPPSRLGKPKTGGYPMKDKKHAAIAKGFAAMHHDPDKAAIDAKADAILAKKRGGRIEGGTKKPHLGRAGRAVGGRIGRQGGGPAPNFNDQAAQFRASLTAGMPGGPTPGQGQQMTQPMAPSMGQMGIGGARPIGGTAVPGGSGPPPQQGFASAMPNPQPIGGTAVPGGSGPPPQQGWQMTPQMQQMMMAQAQQAARQQAAQQQAGPSSMFKGGGRVRRLGRVVK